MVLERNFGIWVAESFFWYLLPAEDACTFFASWCKLRLFCFFGDGNVGGTGDMCHLNEIFLVSL